MQALRAILVQIQQGVRSFRPEGDTPAALADFQATAKRLRAALDRSYIRDAKFRVSHGRDDYGSILSAIVIGDLTLEGEQFLQSTPDAASVTRMKLFISHSSADAKIAEAFVILLRTALNLPSHEIRCTSVDGFKLPIGTDVNEHLRREVHEALVFVALLSPSSVESPYVLFELGARWGSGKYLAPVTVGGMLPGELSAPLSATHAVNGANANDLHQLISELAARLQLTPEGPNVYGQALQNFLAAEPKSFWEAER